MVSEVSCRFPAWFAGSCGSSRNSALCLLKGLFYSPAFSFLHPIEPFFFPLSPLTSTYLCRSHWWRTGKLSFCTLLTSVQAQVASRSMCCGGRSGTRRALEWLWRVLMTLSWKTSTPPPVNSSNPTMVGTWRRPPGTERDRSYQEELLSTCRVFCPRSLSTGFPAHVMKVSVSSWLSLFPQACGIQVKPSSRQTLSRSMLISQLPSLVVTGDNKTIWCLAENWRGSNSK